MYLLSTTALIIFSEAVSLLEKMTAYITFMECFSGGNKVIIRAFLEEQCFSEATADP